MTHTATKIQRISISKLQPAEYNPRQISTKDYEQLRKSLQRFGMVEPIVVNVNEQRKFVVIGGHQRLNAWRSLGNKTIPAIFVDVDLEREKELNVRLNRNVGEWDGHQLETNYTLNQLLEYGFNEQELTQLFDEMPEFEEPQQQETTTNEPAKIKLKTIALKLPHNEARAVNETLAAICDANTWTHKATAVYYLTLLQNGVSNLQAKGQAAKLDKVNQQ